MGIKFQCQACGKNLNVKSHLAGRRGICPHCQAKLVIPTSADDASVPVPVSQTETAATDQGDPSIEVQTGEESRTAVTVDPSKAPPAGESAVSSRRSSDAAPEPQDVKWFVRPAAGGQYGPASSKVMQDWLRQGRIGAESLVWREGWQEWKKASEVIFRSGDTPTQPAIPTPTPRPVADPTTVGQPAGTSRPHEATAATPTGAAQPFPETTGAPNYRRRSNNSGIIWVVLLAVAVAILLPVLIYVLWQQPNSPGEGDDTTGFHGQRPPIAARLDAVGDSVFL